jgi:hypothetical protein
MVSTGLIRLRIENKAGSSEESNEHWGFMKYGNFLDQLRNC